jgi:pilus assembly protein CpaC
VRAIQPDRIGRLVNPSTAGLPALPAQQLPKIRQAQQDPQALRVELSNAASPVISVPLIEGSQASSVPAPAGAPMMLENPLVGAPEPQAPEAAPVKTESLAPVVQRANLQPKVIPATGAHAIQPAQFAGSGDNSLDESQAIHIQKHSLPGEQEYASPSPAASRTISAAAMQPVEPPAQPAVLQPLPGGEEFGQLPEGSPFETIGESGTIKLRVRRSMLLRTKVDVYRTATVDEAVVELVQFTPREISLIGRSQGQTHITFWFNDPAQPPVTYLVEVSPDAQAIKVEEEKYKLLENVINEMFPDSKVYLVLVADKLLVKGQARDSEEAAQIMTIIRAQGGNLRGGFGGLTEGVATPVLSLAATGNAPGPGYTIINMLRVPGVQQVALKVKIAELNRSAARGFGVNVAGAVDIGNNGDELIFASILNGITGGGTSVIASLDGGDLDIGMRYLQQRGVIRLLSEPTLVTLSGRPATFIAGGEFAVPTIVGNVGLNAVTTDFRSFGAIISFVPVIVDKDRIRLQVAPEFSQINNQLSVGGTPGLNVRAATTTVEMREGQTLAIAGLLEDNYNSTTAGDLPFLAQIFGRRSASHNETELIILVTPELVHPMEPEEVPPLPGFDVTEPTAGEFFLAGHIEGNPTRDHRSTVWPRLKRRYGMGGPAMTSGPFGHGQ